MRIMPVLFISVIAGAAVARFAGSISHWAKPKLIDVQRAVFGESPAEALDPAGTSATDGHFADPSAAGPAHPAPERPAAQTVNGVLRKVLIVRDDVHLRRTPGGESVASPTPGFFQQMFVFADRPDSAGNPVAFEVGPDPFKPAGWVSADEAKSWDTRLALRLTADTQVFATSQQAESFLTGKGGEAFAMGYGRHAAREQPYPIISTRTLRLSDGREVTLSELLFVGHTPTPTPTPTTPTSTPTTPTSTPTPASAAVNARQGQKERDLLSQMDFRVVCDFTGSMQPAIDQVRTQIHQTAESVASAYPQARVTYSALAYRDYCSDTPWVTSWLALGGDCQAFDQGLASERAAGGGDAAEALFSGLDTALSRDWNTDPSLGQRVLLIVAQTSAHELGLGNPRGLNVEKLAAAARSKNVVLFALQVPAGEEEDAARLRAQLRSLCGPTGGQVFDLKDAASLRSAIDSTVKERARTAAARVQVHQAVETGGAGSASAEQVADRTGVALADVKAAFVFLKKSTTVFERSSAHAAPGPQAATGWIISRIGAQSFADVYVFCSRPEIEFLNGELQQFVSLSASPETLAAVGDNGGRLQADGWLASARTESLAAWLNSYGVFIHPDSLLWFSQQELLSMPEARRRQVRELVQSRHLPALILARNSDSWSASGWGFVPQRDFP